MAGIATSSTSMLTVRRPDASRSGTQMTNLLCEGGKRRDISPLQNKSNVGPPLSAPRRRRIFVEPLQNILACEAVAAFGRGMQQRDGARRVPLTAAAVQQAVG